MDCKEFKTLVTDLFDKDVDPHIKAECEEHISQCSECKEYYEELQATAELLSPKHTPVIPISYNRWLSSPIQKIAAIVLAAVFLGGLAWAISPHILSSEANSPNRLRYLLPALQGRGKGEGLHSPTNALTAFSPLSLLIMVSRFVSATPQHLR